MNLEQIQELEQERISLGLSVRVWSKQHNIPFHTYGYWVKKTRQKPSTPSGNFIPLQISDNPAILDRSQSSELDINIRTTSGTDLHLTGAFSVEMLSALISSAIGGSNV